MLCLWPEHVAEKAYHPPPLKTLLQSLLDIGPSATAPPSYIYNLSPIPQHAKLSTTAPIVVILGRLWRLLRTTTHPLYRL